MKRARILIYLGLQWLVIVALVHVAIYYQWAGGLK